MQAARFFSAWPFGRRGHNGAALSRINETDFSFFLYLPFRRPIIIS